MFLRQDEYHIVDIPHGQCTSSVHIDNHVTYIISFGSPPLQPSLPPHLRVFFKHYIQSQSNFVFAPCCNVRYYEEVLDQGRRA